MAQRDVGWFAAHLPSRGAVSFAEPGLGAQLSRGSLMLEFTLMQGEVGPLGLVHLGSREGWLRFFSLALDGEGHLSLVQRQGDAVHALSLDVSSACQAGGRMRVTWSWDCEKGLSRLSLEAVDGGSLRQKLGHDPLAMPRADLAALAAAQDGTQLGPRVEWLALGDHVQPVGPGACFAPATPIATPKGERPAASLKAGDWVETADAGPQKVLWSGRVSLPALGALRPVRLCAPFFGATRDLWLWPRHRVALGGAAVDYLFGEDEVLIGAQHLVDGVSAQQPDRPCVLNWHGILLEGHHLLSADGCLIESLSLGRLARTPALARTTALADLGSELPLHGAAARRVLRTYEAQALAAERRRRDGPVAA
ncbi:Hint domain-containing protein [Rhodobacter aestuarii]|uniref:Hint domain-containing protein n=1 Tax=Rhodobacter aestuarii TaxID=453582 RepID=A0A1N7N4C9_9RHOB|nr:Hint domain-containing protein [Rhodobacter aestuarii]PTV96227.1 Hint domain-containing protein [Rhodobacter aestuarii]SIS93194.1 Hint domain-containing protein [Rhodobacter aestuarii]